MALRPMLLGAGLWLSPGPIGLWSPSVEVGGAALWVHGSATAARGYQATSVDRAIGAAYLRAGVALSLSARLADFCGGAAPSQECQSCILAACGEGDPAACM